MTDIWTGSILTVGRVGAEVNVGEGALVDVDTGVVNFIFSDALVIDSWGGVSESVAPYLGVGSVSESVSASVFSSFGLGVSKCDKVDTFAGFSVGKCDKSANAATLVEVGLLFAFDGVIGEGDVGVLSSKCVSVWTLVLLDDTFVNRVASWATCLGVAGCVRIVAGAFVRAGCVGAGCFEFTVMHEGIVAFVGTDCVGIGGQVFVCVFDTDVDIEFAFFDVFAVGHVAGCVVFNFGSEVFFESNFANAGEWTNIVDAVNAVGIVLVVTVSKAFIAFVFVDANAAGFGVSGWVVVEAGWTGACVGSVEVSTFGVFAAFVDLVTFVDVDTSVVCGNVEDKPRVVVECYFGCCRVHDVSTAAAACDTSIVVVAGLRSGWGIGTGFSLLALINVDTDGDTGDIGPVVEVRVARWVENKRFGFSWTFARAGAADVAAEIGVHVVFNSC
jgi:hypothetical protein